MDSKKDSIFFIRKKCLFCQINWNEQKTNVQHHKRNIIMTIILYLTKKFSWILSLQPFGIFFRFVLFFVSLSRGSHKTAHRLTKFHLFHIHISNSGIQKKNADIHCDRIDLIVFVLSWLSLKKKSNNFILSLSLGISIKRIKILVAKKIGQK